MPRLDPHPLWQHLPAERRSLRSLRALQYRRGLAWINRRRQRIGIAVGLYLVIWLVPLLFKHVLITSFALLPLVLVPPVGGLVYWLVWQEFHG